MIINHPLLGPRDAAEFYVMGDADLINRPDPDADGAAEAFYEYAYLRDNPTGEHRELGITNRVTDPGWSSPATRSRMKSSRSNWPVMWR